MLEDKIKVPEGMFAVCAWDPSNPEKSVPRIAKTETTDRDAVYKSERYAIWYAKLRNERWCNEIQDKKRRGKIVIGETEYFVINDKGNRIY